VSAGLAALDADAPGLDAALARLRDEDVLGELLERRGRTAELATEAGDVKLSWVDQLAWALDHPEVLADVEALADSLHGRFRHLVWAGMGGSVQTVHSLRGLGLLEGAGLTVHPLDSTDPAALNRLLRAVGGDLAGTAMVGVSMGMTSEEPISHLRWFTGLLAGAGVRDAASHVLVMTLPGSYLDDFAKEHGSRRVDIQPDGESHTPGRMSAPTTRVFLLPAALALREGAGRLGRLLRRVQDDYGLRPGLSRAERDALVATDPFVRLAAWLSAQVDAGRDMVLLDLPERWRGLAPWIEQVVEESLGKGGRGLLVFPGQDLAAARTWPDRCVVLRADEGNGNGGGGELPGRPLARLGLGQQPGTAERLATAARVFAGWDLAVALFGRLQGITFSGQPAVEGYKRYARELRDAPGPLPYPDDAQVSDRRGRLVLYHGASGLGLAGARDPAEALAAACSRLLEANRLGYLDVTLNGEPEGPLWERLRWLATDFANRRLARPVKVRSGPRDYHSTEQSETDGPPDLLSLRVLLRRHEPVAAGEYDDRFLQAQALGTMLAMRDAGRHVLLAMLERAEDATALDDLFSGAAARLA
jgi:hypothetical protein